MCALTQHLPVPLPPYLCAAALSHLTLFLPACGYVSCIVRVAGASVSDSAGCTAEAEVRDRGSSRRRASEIKSASYVTPKPLASHSRQCRVRVRHAPNAISLLRALQCSRAASSVAFSCMGAWGAWNAWGQHWSAAYGKHRRNTSAAHWLPSKRG